MDGLVGGLALLIAGSAGLSAGVPTLVADFVCGLVTVVGAAHETQISSGGDAALEDLGLLLRESLGSEGHEGHRGE